MRPVPTETFVNYWIGQEPTPPSPGLDQMPAYVDVAPLAFVTVDSSGELDFDFLCTTNSPETIKGWIKDVKANGNTKVLFSIMVGGIDDVPVDAFVASVAQNAVEWDVDGVDLDYEPTPVVVPSDALLTATASLRPALTKALGRDPLITAPVFSQWLGGPDYDKFLKSFADELDFLTTMDYTPWGGLEAATSLFESYSGVIGDPGKIALGVSCMEPPAPRSPDEGYNWTPLADVEAGCTWEPEGGTKKGMQLYTYSYDVETRGEGGSGGTGYPDFTFTQTIEANLP